MFYFIPKGLFHRAIVQSGNAIAPYNFPVSDPLEQAREQAKVLNVPNAEKLNSSKIVEELRKVDAATLVESSDKMKFWSVDPIVLFRTAIEPPGPSAFICENPIDTVRTGNYKHVPWMTGLVPNEGTVRATAILNNSTDLKELNNRFDELMPKLMQINLTREELADYWPKVKDFYFDGQSHVNDTNWQKFVDVRIKCL